MTTGAQRLKFLAGINARTLPETTDPELEFRYIDIGSVGRGQLMVEPETIRFEEAPSRARRVVRTGDCLVSTVRTYLRAVLPVGPGLDGMIASTGFAALTPGPRLEPRYLGWVAQSDPFIEEIVARSTGVSYPAINALEIGNLEIPAPPVEVQRAIADYLDTETARIDTLIAKKRTLLAACLDRATQQQAELACGRDSQRAERRDSGQPWLGEIPAEWGVSRLKYEARLESGHTPSRTRPELWENCTIPWVTLNDVGNMASLEFIDRTVNLISEEGIASSSARVLPAGTVVLSRDATIGRTSILAVPMATSQHFADWICGDRLDPRYLWLLFRTVMKPHFDSLTDGATLRTIGMPDIRELVVPLPPLDDQHRIVDAAAAIRERSRNFESAALRQIDLLVEHRQALITAAVTGEFEVPGVAA